MKSRDINVLKHIIATCNEIQDDITRFKISYCNFSEDTSYQRLLAFSILQIRKLVKHFF
jgi:hypothetical protein